MSMTNTGNLGLGPTDQTAERLIDAAERLFAERGFAGTSVRDLTTAAGCNVASVNYHFGSKARLYEVMFERTIAELREMRVEAVSAVARAAAEAGDPEPIVRAFAESFLRPLRDRERGMRLLRLFMNEMNDPQLPPSVFLDGMVRPMEQLMSRALCAACPGLTEFGAAACMHSIVGQLVHIANAWQVYEHAGQTHAPVYDLDHMIAHIVRFSVAGIRTTQESEATP